MIILFLQLENLYLHQFPFNVISITPVQFADIFAGIVRHYYENELDQKEPETDFQKIGKNFSYPVSDKLSDSEE